MLKKYWHKSFHLEGLVHHLEVKEIEVLDHDRVIWDGEEIGLHLEVEVLEEDVDFPQDVLRFEEALVVDLEVLHQGVVEVHQEELVSK